MRIAIFGGSFNPIHNGHIALARHIAEKKPDGIEEVWMMVTPRNPLKPDVSMLSNEHRLRMVELATRGSSNIKPCDFEFSLQPPYYSIRNLDELSKTYPQHTFSLAVGADNWLAFDKWHQPRRILEDYGLIIYPRPGSRLADFESLPDNTVYLNDAPLFDISSTEIRRRLHDGKSLKNLVPDMVEAYIQENQLYK